MSSPLASTSYGGSLTSRSRDAAHSRPLGHRLTAKPSRLRQQLASTRSTQTAGAVASSAEVACDVERTSWNSRKLFASVSICAPIDTVWGALTDYEGLGTFIPSLVENRCLRRTKKGAVIYQVGAQDVAMGVKFSAACTLECTEYIGGTPASLCSTTGNSLDGQFPIPRLPGQTSWPPAGTASGKGNGAHSSAQLRDITFKLIEGDFQAFCGIWRMQPGVLGPDSTLLGYALYVQPQAWLPVGLIEGRIRKEVLRNLQAVRKHTEALHCRNQPPRISLTPTGSMMSDD